MRTEYNFSLPPSSAVKYTVRESGDTAKLFTARSMPLGDDARACRRPARASPRGATRCRRSCRPASSSTASSVRPSGVNRGCDQLSLPVVIWRGSPPLTFDDEQLRIGEGVRGGVAIGGRGEHQRLVVGREFDVDFFAGVGLAAGESRAGRELRCPQADRAGRRWRARRRRAPARRCAPGVRRASDPSCGSGSRRRCARSPCARDAPRSAPC